MEPINLSITVLHLLSPHIIILKAIISKNSIMCKYQLNFNTACSKVNCSFSLLLFYVSILPHPFHPPFIFILSKRFFLLDIILHWFNFLKPILNPYYRSIDHVLANLKKNKKRFKKKEISCPGVTARCQSLDE